MSEQELGRDSRRFVDAALRGEPGIAEDSRLRMRARLLGAGAGCAVLAAKTATAAGGTKSAAAVKAASIAGAGAKGAGAAAATLFTSSAIVKGAIALIVVGGAVGVARLELSGRPRPQVPSAVVSASPVIPLSPDSPPAQRPTTSASSASIDVRALGIAASATAPAAHDRVVSSTVVGSTMTRVEAADVTARPAETALPSPRGAPPPSTTGTSFVEELALLDRARRATAARNEAEALEALARMRRLPGADAFAEERAALEIVALCSGAHKGEGRAQLASFRAAFPRSLQTDRTARACADE